MYYQLITNIIRQMSISLKIRLITTPISIPLSTTIRANYALFFVSVNQQVTLLSA